METNHPFVTATRQKLRFPTTKGTLATEDLFDLSLADLDRIAIAVNKTANQGGESFLSNPSRPDPKAKLAELQLEVLKGVIQIREAENAAKAEQLAKAKRREFLKNLLEKKEIEGMESLTPEQIEAKLKELDS